MSDKKEEPEEFPRFVENEKILCFHGPLIYEAKIQKVETKNKQTKYFIHYHGWNKNWDEWVPEARMLKYTEMNLEKKRELNKAHEANSRAKKAAALKRKIDSPTPTSSAQTNVVAPEQQANKETKPGISKPEEPAPPEAEAPSAPPPTPAPVVSQQPPRKAKNKKKDDVSTEPSTTPTTSSSKAEDLKPPDSTVETEEQFYAKVEVKIKVPDKLKPFLVDDWDYLTRQRKLAILPSRITVDQVISDYVKAKKSSKVPASHKENAILEVTSGLREYFNVMLGSQLLYKFEREQLADIMKEHPDKPMSKIYGPIHFLRLFVKLGGMLAYTPLDDKSIQLLLYYIDDFLSYMEKNSSNLFMIQDYGTAPPEYHRRAL